MKTASTVLSLLGMLTLVAVTSGEEQPTPRKPVVGPEWKPMEESTVLPAGIKAHATYHFNRNALSAASLTEDGVLAITDTGNLLRFDLKDLRLQQEIRPDAAFTLLIRAEGIGVLAACADGRVFRIDPKTLKQTEFAKLDAAPRWMTGFYDASKKKNGVLAVVLLRGEKREDDQIELHRLGFEQPNSEKYKNPSSLFTRGEISSFFLDGKSRLWLGKDAGEWGGWCGSLDVNAGKAGQVEELKDFGSNVYGFVELPDGQVWAYGGMMHLSLCSGFVSRIDHGKAERLGDYGGGFEVKPEPSPKRPRYPITHIIPDPKGDGLLVFSYSDLFNVDAKLKDWKYLGAIEFRYRAGRPDAMGAYPALRMVLAIGGKSSDLLCTSARDGLLRISEGQVAQYVVPGQLGDDQIRTILPAAGTNLLAGSDVWRYTGDGWQTTSMFPPTQPNKDERWHDYKLMMDPDRRPVALCGSDRIPGSVALTRWKDGKVEILTSESSESVRINPLGAFATPDGGFWCAERGRVLRLVDGKWQQVGKAPDDFLWHFHVVGQGKSPWILHCEGRLYRLTPGKGMEDAALTPISLPTELGKVQDALALESGQILLACTAGLRLFDDKSGKVTECPFAAPKGEVQAICKDGRGRTWLAGSSVWIVDAKGKVHDLGKLDRYGDMAYGIGADSTDATGVIVALGQRGVLFVRAEEADR
jgi:hypothetical protein